MMDYVLFDTMEACSEQELARLMHVVSQQRLEQALRYKHVFGQYCCLKAYEMLMQLLQDRSKPEFIYNEYGQPQLPNGPFFSISHCKAGIVVAISDRPIGVDIETIRQIQPALIEKTMNTQEQHMIAQAVDPNKAFTQLWTKKEAYLKMMGTGIIDDLHSALENTKHVHFHSIEQTEKNYVVTLAHSTIDGEHLPGDIG